MGAMRAKPTNISMTNKVLIPYLDGSLKVKPTNVSITNRVFVSWWEP